MFKIQVSWQNPAFQCHQAAMWSNLWGFFKTTSSWTTRMVQLLLWREDAVMLRGSGYGAFRSGYALSAMSAFLTNRQINPLRVTDTTEKSRRFQTQSCLGRKIITVLSGSRQLWFISDRTNKLLVRWFTLILQTRMTLIQWDDFTRLQSSSWV